VDGKPATLLRANHAFQAVQVPTGDHRVDVIYQDKPFQIGAVVSLLSFVGVGFGCALTSRRWTPVASNQDSGVPQAPAEAPIQGCLPHGAP
jgi:hypothetical protein